MSCIRPERTSRAELRQRAQRRPRPLEVRGAGALPTAFGTARSIAPYDAAPHVICTSETESEPGAVWLSVVWNTRKSSGRAAVVANLKADVEEGSSRPARPRAVVHDVDPVLPEGVRRADPREHQEVRRLEPAGAEDDLISTEGDRPPLSLGLDSDGSGSVEEHPADQRLAQHRQVLAPPDRREITDGRVHPYPVDALRVTGPTPSGSGAFLSGSSGKPASRHAWTNSCETGRS